LLEKNFSTEIKENKGKLTMSYGAFKLLTLWFDNKKLYVETQSDKEVKDDVILDTNKRYRVFLEEATGYTARERLAKAKKEVQGD
jgi:hypothetical protein